MSMKFRDMSALSPGSFLVSHTTPLNRKERGIWWPCIQRIVRTECNNYKKRYGQPQNVQGWPYTCTPLVRRCQVTNSNLDADWMQQDLVAGTTRDRCMQGHQTPLSLDWGVWLARLAHSKVFKVKKDLPTFSVQIKLGNCYEPDWVGTGDWTLILRRELIIINLTKHVHTNRWTIVADIIPACCWLAAYVGGGPVKKITQKKVAIS